MDFKPGSRVSFLAFAADPKTGERLRGEKKRRFAGTVVGFHRRLLRVLPDPDQPGAPEYWGAFKGDVVWCRGSELRSLGE